MSKRVAILGATSAIAEATARLYARDGATMVLAGRNSAKLEAIAADLKLRGAANVRSVTGDLADSTAQDAIFAALSGDGAFDIVLIAYGTLGDQAASQDDPTATAAMLHGNFISVTGWLIRCTNLMRAKGGTIAVISSVAGDRGRRSNYVYGAAKGALSRYIEGLQHRFAGTALRVIDIRPGFVDTPMTAGITKDGPLWTRPEQVARDIQRAIAKGSPLVYTPWFWRFIMLIIRNLPRTIFNRMSV